MIIYSGNRLEFLRIEPRAMDSGGHIHIVYAVTGMLQKNELTNDAVVLEAPKEFLASLMDFERTRTGSIALKGTEDFYLGLEPDGESGAVWVSFHVNKYFTTASPRTGTGKGGQVTLKGSFSISGEDMAGVVQGFVKLFRGL